MQDNEKVTNQPTTRKESSIHQREQTEKNGLFTRAIDKIGGVLGRKRGDKPEGHIERIDRATSRDRLAGINEELAQMDQEKPPKENKEEAGQNDELKTSQGIAPEISERSKHYQNLHERGVKLPDKEIDYILAQLSLGCIDALQFLNREEDPMPQVIFSSNLDNIGYIVGEKVINIPVPYMNELATSSVPLKARWKKLYTIQDKKGELSDPRIPYRYFLRLVGREETIHHYQNIGHPMLKAHLPNEDMLHIPEEFLCDFEVEARKTVDKICVAKGEKPIWKPFDDFLKRVRPKAYNKPAKYFLEKEQ